MPLYLPDRHGAYREIKLPKYMLPVLFREVQVLGTTEPLLQPRIQEAGLYRYRLIGWNHYRKDYGITDDMEKLYRWCKRHGFPPENIRYHFERKNTYAEFDLYDPIALQMEKAGMIEMRKF